MARRIEIELTSDRKDGTWTWRAAGAKAPKGVLDASLLYAGAKTGDVVRADAETAIDGNEILHVYAPTAAKVAPSNLIALVGSGRDEPLVSTNLSPKRGGRDNDRDFIDDRAPRNDKGPRTGGGMGSGGMGSGGAGGKGRGRQEKVASARYDLSKGPAGSPESMGIVKSERKPRDGASSRDTKRAPREGSAVRTPRPPREGGQSNARPSRFAPKPPPKKIVAVNTHRDAILSTLTPEQHLVADQLLRGGMPGLRAALASQNVESKKAGKPEQDEKPLIVIAEEIWPTLKAAAWRDRAEACLAIIDEVGLRDLRQLVSESDSVARDDETRLIASKLRDSMEARVEKAKTEWKTEFDDALNGGRIVRALKMATRPPDPTLRLDAEVAKVLAEKASAAMSPDAPVDRWIMMLEAVSASPVRRLVKPVGMPANPPESLVHAATAQAGNIPALVQLLGLQAAPPPRPPRAGTKSNGAKSNGAKSNGAKPNGARGGRPTNALQGAKPKAPGGIIPNPVIGSTKPAPVAKAPVARAEVADSDTSPTEAASLPAAELATTEVESPASSSQVDVVERVETAHADLVEDAVIGEKLEQPVTEA